MPRQDAWVLPDDGLLPLEIELLRMAEAGELLSFGEGPFDLAAMNEWGPERTIRAVVLRRLLVEEQWPVHAKGAQLRGARITGHLDLESATLRCPLRLDHCILESPRPVALDFATASLLTLTGCQLAGITGDRLVVTRELVLNGSTFAGPLLLRGADIMGQLSCRDAKLTGFDGEGTALAAQGIKTGTLFLDQGFTTAGAVRLWDADIAGSLLCGGAHLGADGEGNALLGDRVKVGGSVHLSRGVSSPRRFTAAGAVRLWDANITGILNCSGALLIGTDRDGNSLFADGLNVGADVLLAEEFTAAGAVTLRSAHIEGSLRLTSAKLAHGEHRTALDITGAQISHELRWAPGEQVKAQVTLVGATVGQLTDDWIQTQEWPGGDWPPQGLLRLDGFTYTRIGGEHPANGKQRLDWLRSQHNTVTTDTGPAFATQPYEQLVKVYAEAGQDIEARKVAIACRRDLRRYGNLTWYRRVINWFLDVTIRYGYQTGRALAGIVFLYAAVLAFFWFARYQSAIIPVQPISGLHPVPTADHCTANYPCFNPFGYAIDTVIPLINVHQADFWGPNASVPWGRICVAVTYLGTGLGWLLATLAVAGYTGIVRNVKTS